VPVATVLLLRRRRRSVARDAARRL
jgi:hypothetical protein